MNKLVIALLFIVALSSCKNSPKQTDSQKNESADIADSNLKYLSSPADSVSAEPYLFTDKNGLVYLSWIEKTKEKSLLKFSALKNEQWSEPVMISSGDNWFVNWADYPQLATDGGKSMVAHFLEKSEKGTYTYDVKLVTSADQGKIWSTPKILHDDGEKAEHGFVSIVPYEDNYFISWLDGRNAAMEGEGKHEEGHHGQMTIRGAIVDKQGKKSSEWELDNRVCDCCQTSAVITANGPVVVYRDRSEAEIRDISIVRFVKGQWTKPEPIFSDNWEIKGCPVNGPRIAAQGNTVAVAWFSSPDQKAQVNVIFSGDGGTTFNAPVRIDEGKGIGRVDVVMLDDKSAMVSWMEGSVIKAVKVYTDGKKEASITIASSAESRSSGFPQMTKSGNNLVFAWTDEKDKKIKVANLAL
ncbi:sialidase family protein [Flavihumibacter sp. ZG627]|uniref:sialidase family protein n=1 Tax=Flavihumibacter sp. ZG627 TaxID=1463156 RepID=UPI00057CC3C5|nr:sialidase family protein [Flavihumibacter sp. ZG627]KIC89874.1 BNR repeat protein [Flavihumibacter sp. ZG627]